MPPQPSKTHPETYSRLSAEINKLLEKSRGKVKENKIKLQGFRGSRDLEIQSTEAQIKIEGLRDYFLMRRSWNKFLKACLAAILGFNIILVYMSGTGQLIFNDEWFLRIVLTTNMADIIGLVYLVVRFLFPNQISESRNEQ